MLASQTDSWALVEAAQGGDAAAFAELYRRYAGAIRAFLMFRTADRELVEDITSETFARALGRLHGLDDRGCDFGAWLRTVARNLLCDHFRSGQFRCEEGLAPAHEETQWEADVLSQVLRRAESAELWRCVRQLPGAQCECVMLRFGHALSVAETAARMRRGTGAVRALQYRAVRSLARMLALRDVG